MTPIDRIREKYQLHPQEQPFEFYLNWHLAHGFVYSTPDFFIMGRPTHLILGLDEWNKMACDIDTACEPKLENGWYVHAMAGNISKVWSILPYELPYVAFERVRNNTLDLTVIPLDRIRRLSLDAIPEHTLA